MLSYYAQQFKPSLANAIENADEAQFIRLYEAQKNNLLADEITHHRARIEQKLSEVQKNREAAYTNYQNNKEQLLKIQTLYTPYFLQKTQQQEIEELTALDRQIQALKGMQEILTPPATAHTSTSKVSDGASKANRRYCAIM